MKKVYEKPMLYAESYELMEHIAGGCILDGMSTPTHRSELQCGFRVNDNSGAIAFQTRSICENWWNEDFDAPLEDIFCYNSFKDTGAMFAS